ncbi:MAG: deoxyuridine 5'-triphosphate nucleotidohydrolase [Bacillaceae bacterium G1]|nr:dUTP diphosphatase [Bacillota bacterium]OJF16839.1 MAG: deoxyuridine 5'-triphosphate nucleotidohydrolase [Bacillaceae bacterium G1]
MIEIQVQRLPGCEDVPLPQKMSAGASGYDLHAALDEPVTLLPGERRLIPTGLKIQLPYGYEAQVRPRSGLALKHGLTVLNAPGTIDSDYRGEIGVILINLGQEAVTIHRGDRIAQMVIQPVTDVRWRMVEQLTVTERGSGGFGHTGV